MSAMSKNKSEKKTFIKFLGVILLSGLAGGVISILVQMQEKNIAILLQEIGEWIGKNAVYMEVGLFVLCTAFATVFYLRAKHLFKHSDIDDEVVFEQIDWHLSVGLGFVGVSTPLLLIFFGIATTYTDVGTVESVKEVAGILGNTIFFLAAVGCNLYLQWLMVNMTKKLYPEKRGNIFDGKFEKEWMDSSDEAEKFMTYKAAYETHRKMQFLFITVIVIMLLFSIEIPMGVTPYLIVGVLWVGNIILYVYESLKVSRQKL